MRKLAMNKDILQELREYEEFCVNNDELQVAELIHQAQLEIIHLREKLSKENENER